MGCYLGALLNIKSAMMRDNIAKRLTPETLKAWTGCNSLNTCLNGTNEESITIYAKNRCQWSGCLIETKLK